MTRGSGGQKGSGWDQGDMRRARQWSRVAAESDEMTYFSVPYKFVLYVRKGCEDLARKIIEEQ